MLRSLFIIFLVGLATIPGSGQQRPLITDDIDITPASAIEISAGVGGITFGVTYLSPVFIPIAK